MPKWIKETDPNIPNQIRFVNPNKEGDIKEITFSNIGKQLMGFNILLKDEPTADELSNFLQSHKKIFYANGSSVSCTTIAKPSLENLFILLHDSRQRGIDDDFINQLNVELKFKKPESLVVDQMLAILQYEDDENNNASTTSENTQQQSYINAFEFALQAQEEGYYTPIWELATMLHSINVEAEKDKPYLPNISLVQQIYESISANSPYYKEANAKLHEATLTIQPQTKDDAIQLKETEFRSALNSMLDQSVIDRLFNELCGFKFKEPKYKNVQGDPELLIAIARDLRETKQKLSKYELEAYKAEKPPRIAPRRKFNALFKEKTNPQEDSPKTKGPRTTKKHKKH